MNSILQPLIHCPPFYNYFDDLAKGGVPTGSLIKALYFELLISRIEFLGEFKDDMADGKYF